MLHATADLRLSSAAGIHDCIENEIAVRLAAKDPGIWGRRYVERTRARMGLVDVLRIARESVPGILAGVDSVRSANLNRIVLCGMGGSSLAPDVICRNFGVELLVLDSSHPDMVAQAVQELERTFVIISSKTGTTIETVGHLRQFVQAFEDAGLVANQHMAIVTDPESPFDTYGTDHEIPVILGDPTIGGRYSALTAFGLVPSAIAGADIARLLDEAISYDSLLQSNDESNPAIVLGAIIAASARARLGVIAIDDRDYPGLGLWIEQLVAESLGKRRTGVLPVIVSPPDGYVPQGAVRVILGTDAAGHGSDTVTIDAPLGAQFLLWEYAVAIAAYLLDVNPFDQPDVEAAKEAARRTLAEGYETDEPDFIDGTIQAWGVNSLTLLDAILQCRAAMPLDGYLVVTMYLDRWRHAGAELIANEVSRHILRPVTFAWGPQYLHSTGQLHKGGPLKGTFIQVTAQPEQDFMVPRQSYSWGQMLSAQASGDAAVLEGLGLTVLRLNLGDVESDLARLREALLY
ncbi:MAG: glucose-6-phosphate isomerase [Aeromicrobium sp.]|nr:MAG: glucose-6-phosphate isomerase [Aeromicrobium sp.]